MRSRLFVAKIFYLLIVAIISQQEKIFKYFYLNKLINQPPTISGTRLYILAIATQSKKWRSSNKHLVLVHINIITIQVSAHMIELIIQFLLRFDKYIEHSEVHRPCESTYHELGVLLLNYRWHPNDTGLNTLVN